MKPRYFTSLLMLVFLACKPGTPVDTQSTSAEQPTTNPIVSDTNATASKDTLTTQPEAPKEESKPLEPAKPKICDPNFTKLSSPKNYQHIVYVTNFNPEEFKCWVDLENYGIELSAGNTCIIYFVDKANIKATTTPPHYLDDNTLKTAAIGRFEYNGKYWEIYGSGRWKRTGKGYGYYNTDNQLGG